MSKLIPTAYTHRSFVYRQLLAASAKRFVEVDNAAVADAFTEPTIEQARFECAGLIDLSPLPRIGFKGNGTPEWLSSQGLTVPDLANQSLVQDNGAIVARFSSVDVIVLGNPITPGGDGLPQKLDTAWHQAEQPPTTPRGFPLPRQSSHAWLALTGEQMPQALTKLCHMDLRPQQFNPGSVVQTMLGGISGIVICHQHNPTLIYHLLIDSSFASYLFNHLQAFIEESGGGLVGLATLKTAL